MHFIWEFLTYCYSIILRKIRWWFIINYQSNRTMIYRIHKEMKEMENSSISIISSIHKASRMFESFFNPYLVLCCVVLWYGMVWYGMVCVILGPVVEVEEEEVIRCSCYGC